MSSRDLILLGVVLITLLGVAFYWLFSSTRKQLTERYMRTQVEVLRAELANPLANEVENIRRQVVGLVNEISVRGRATPFFDGSNYASQSAQAQLDSTIDRFQSQETNVLAIQLFDSDGLLVLDFHRNGLASGKLLKGLPLSVEIPKFSKNKTSFMTISKKLRVTKTGLVLLDIFADVITLDQTAKKGTIWVVWNMTSVLQHIRGKLKSADADKFGRVYLINDFGECLFSSVEEADSIPVLDSNLPQLLKSRRNKWFVTEAEYLSLVLVKMSDQQAWRFVGVLDGGTVSSQLSGKLFPKYALALVSLLLVIALFGFAMKVQDSEFQAQKEAEMLELSLRDKERSERFLQSVFDAITDVIVVQDTNYNIIRANKVARDVYGQDMVGRKCYQVYRNKTEMDCENCPVDATIRRSAPHATEMTNAATNEVWQIHNFPLINEESDIQLIIEHARNITETRSLEAKLIQSEKLSTLGEMAAGIAHEINNPVGVVSMFAQLAVEDLKELDGGEEVLEKIEVIEDHSKQIGKIVKDLLQFARKSEGERQIVPVAKIFDRALAIVELKKMTKEVSISRVGSDRVEVFADEGQIAQVVLNLVVNAIHAIVGEKAENPGLEKEGKIELSTEIVPIGADLPRGAVAAESDVDLRGLRRVRIQVADNGPGMDETKAKKIFDPFFTTKEQGQGTGLGLSVSFGIVRDHNGMIFVQSTPGNGAKFILELPAGVERLGKSSQRLRSIQV